MTNQSSNWASMPSDLLARVFHVYPPYFEIGECVPPEEMLPKCYVQKLFRLVCTAWCTAAGQTVTKATGSQPAALATMHLHMPSLLSLNVQACTLQCKDFDSISRFPQLQRLTYVATENATDNVEEKKRRLEEFDPSQHCLFAASGFSSPFKGLTRLVSLHIEEEIPNVTPQELQPISLLSHLTNLYMHTATFKPGRRSTYTFDVLSSMTSAVYQSLGCLPDLSSLSVDVPSDHVTKLKSLQSLTFTQCDEDWEISEQFTCLTKLTELCVGHGRMTVKSAHTLPCLAKATFSIDAVNWDFLRDLTTVTDLNLEKSTWSNVAFDCLASMTQLTSLSFTMSCPIKGGIDYGCLDKLSTLTALVHMHVKFVARLGAENPEELRAWFFKLPLARKVTEHNVVLRLHQVPPDSDWMSDTDGDVSCISGEECENCNSLLGDLAVFGLQSSSDSDESDMDSSDDDDVIE